MKSMMMPMLVLMALVIAAIVFVVQGTGMHQQVSVQEAKFHALQNSYFTISKAERDGAATGSELNKQLVQVSNYPSELLRLKLVGVGKILTGIFFMLFAIAFLLFMMPFRLAKLMKQNKQ